MVLWTEESECETFPFFISKILPWRILLDFSGVIPDLLEEREVVECPGWVSLVGFSLLSTAHPPYGAMGRWEGTTDYMGKQMKLMTLNLLGDILVISFSLLVISLTQFYP